MSCDMCTFLFIMELFDLLKHLSPDSKVYIVIVLILVFERIGLFQKIYMGIKQLYNDLRKDQEQELEIEENRFEFEAQEEATRHSQTWFRESKLFSILENLIQEDLAKITNSLDKVIVTVDRLVEKDIEQTKILVQLHDSNNMLSSRIVYLSDTIRELTTTISEKVDR